MQVYKIGDLVESKVNGAKIKVVKVWATFITGYQVDFNQDPNLRFLDGFRILSFKNIKSDKH